ncbi:hypothetical protein B6N60_02185 [Richelia sinica FACHB-800]|uniref:Uncharacterized protein n=1 Tax=Richelia sinica FACHB-800 TaxID=1357546 RepID=A0A975T7T5_9NOST|nr:hypothetical protein B6N60_02185 [Richelia sinica FACHB-800]
MLKKVRWDDPPYLNERGQLGKTCDEELLINEGKFLIDSTNNYQCHFDAAS